MSSGTAVDSRLFGAWGSSEQPTSKASSTQCVASTVRRAMKLLPLGRYRWQQVTRPTPAQSMAAWNDPSPSPSWTAGRSTSDVRTAYAVFGPRRRSTQTPLPEFIQSNWRLLHMDDVVAGRVPCSDIINHSLSRIGARRFQALASTSSAGIGSTSPDRNWAKRRLATAAHFWSMSALGGFILLRSESTTMALSSTGREMASAIRSFVGTIGYLSRCPSVPGPHPRHRCCSRSHQAHARPLALPACRPASVSRYLCVGLLGASGWVISMSSASSAGSR